MKINKAVKVGIWISVVAILLLLSVVSVKYYNMRYSDEKLIVELNKYYRGYYLDGKWVSKSSKSEADKKELKEDWEKHGYQFVVNNDDVIVMTRTNRPIAVIKNGKSIEFR